jgi:hypothetical protein
MKKMILILLFSICLSPVLALGQDQDRTISGSIIDINWVGRKLTIRHEGYRSGRPDHISFVVPKNAKFSRGTRSISFLDMKISDMVLVTYYSDDFGGLKARHIDNLNLGN